jgi:carbamoyltransferase
MVYTLGISAFYHDSAAILLRNGIIACAFQEERFSRIKHDNSFPVRSIQACLDFENISCTDLDQICYYENPKLKFNRILKTYALNFPKGCASLLMNFPRYWKMRNIKNIIKLKFRDNFGFFVKEIIFSEHHLSHAASAFYLSPFKTAAVLCIDGVGEYSTVSAWNGKEGKLKLLWTINFPDSLGLLYSAFTYFCGFKVDSGEYKLMGLAPYGEARYVDIIKKHIISINEDGTFALNRKYFNYEVGNEMVSSLFDCLFNGPPRLPETSITQREMDLAASIQAVTEEIVLKLAKRIKKETREKNLCLAGGVALNCVVNGKIAKSELFNQIFVQPASGDAGTALGAALAVYYSKYNSAHNTYDKKEDGMQGSYLGNSYTPEKIRQYLDDSGAVYEVLDTTELINRVCNHLVENKVVAWFQGRMEFGPRALGARSILGNPMSPDMQKVMNLKIKNRESFRPFAPAVLSEYASEWFDLKMTSPYMLIVADVKQNKQVRQENISNVLGMERVNLIRSKIPAVTHIDNSARIQTVDGNYNPLFHSLLKKFYDETQCPILINTSFNVRGEPIVESPKDAYQCFMRTQMDYFVIGPFYLSKLNQPAWKETIDWKKQYELD